MMEELNCLLVDVNDPPMVRCRHENRFATKKFVLLVVLVWILICLVGLIIGPENDATYYRDYLIHYDPHVDYEGVAPLPCPSEAWNQKSTSSFPFYDRYKQYAAKHMTGGEGLSDGQLRLVSAFLYDEYIVVTHTAQNPKGVRRAAYCRFFDCNRREIPDTLFESFVFPMTAVHCPRRVGAKYMSITFEKQDIPQDPVPLLNRIFDSPPHEVGVCVGQIYGEERKWLEIIEFVEHHKLMGVSMFYFTIFEMDGYSKKTIENYERLGEVEASMVHTEYDKINWLFHMIQIHECFFRSKFHSKWVINIDIDERLTMTQMPLISYLRLQPPATCEVNFGSRRVQKLADDPTRYVSEQQLAAELTFLRYNVTTTHQYGAFKAIFKPDKVHMIHFHWTWRQHEGCVVKTAGKRVGYVRHYRTTALQSGGQLGREDQTVHDHPHGPRVRRATQRARVQAGQVPLRAASRLL